MPKWDLCTCISASLLQVFLENSNPYSRGAKQKQRQNKLHRMSEGSVWEAQPEMGKGCLEVTWPSLSLGEGLSRPLNEGSYSLGSQSLTDLQGVVLNLL